MSANKEVYDTVLYKVRGRVATVTLNRPGRYNAIDHQLPYDLRDAINAANKDGRLLL